MGGFGGSSMPAGNSADPFGSLNFVGGAGQAPAANQASNNGFGNAFGSVQQPGQ